MSEAGADRHRVIAPHMTMPRPGFWPRSQGVDNPSPEGLGRCDFKVLTQGHTPIHIDGPRVAPEEVFAGWHRHRADTQRLQETSNAWMGLGRRKRRQPVRKLDQRRGARLGGADSPWAGAGGGARERRPMDRETFKREPEGSARKGCYARRRISGWCEPGLENRVAVTIVFWQRGSRRECGVSGVRRRPPLVRGDGFTVGNGVPKLPRRLN